MSKVVLITGGSSGIGKSIGDFLINKNYKVYGTSRSPKKYRDNSFPIIKLDVNREKLGLRGKGEYTRLCCEVKNKQPFCAFLRSTGRFNMKNLLCKPCHI